MNLMFYFILNSFMLTNRPMQKIMLLIFNLIFIIFNSSLLVKTSWFSIIFMILMVSGLMILFMYMASIQKNTIKNFMFSYSTLNSLFIMVMMWNFMNKHNFHMLTYKPFQENILLNLFNFLNMNIFILLLIMYMLIIMVIYMELMFNFKMPLRSKY